MMRSAVDLDPATDPAWAEASERGGDLFSSPPWIQAISDGFGLTVHGRLHGSGDTAGGLVFAEIDDEMGRRRSTLPFSDFCSPIPGGSVVDWTIADDLIASDVPYSIRIPEVADADLPEGLISAAEFAWHGVDLTPARNDLWATIASNARQGVRKAERMGAKPLVGLAALGDFHRLHVQLRASKYGMLAQPRAFFDALARRFGPERCQLIGAERDGELVAGVLLLRWRDIAYYKFNASSAAGVDAHANDLCMWEAMSFAQSAWGCRLLDLGLSDLDQPGLLRYKQKYATERGALRTYRNHAAIHAPVAPARAVVNAAVELLTAEGVPEEVRIDAAARFYRLFC